MPVMSSSELMHRFCCLDIGFGFTIWRALENTEVKKRNSIKVGPIGRYQLKCTYNIYYFLSFKYNFKLLFHEVIIK